MTVAVKYDRVDGPYGRECTLWVFWDSEELIGHSVFECLRTPYGQKRRSWRGERIDEAERMAKD